MLLSHRIGCTLAPFHVKRDGNQWADELTHPDYQGFAPDLRLRVNRLLRGLSPSFVSAGIRFLLAYGTPPPKAPVVRGEAESSPTRSVRCGFFRARHTSATPFSDEAFRNGLRLHGPSRIATFTFPREVKRSVRVGTFGFRCARVC